MECRLIDGYEAFNNLTSSHESGYERDERRRWPFAKRDIISGNLRAADSYRARVVDYFGTA